MNKPVQFVFSDKASSTLARSGVLVSISIFTIGLILALPTSHATVVDLALSCAALSSLLVVMGKSSGYGCLGSSHWRETRHPQHVHRRNPGMLVIPLIGMAGACEN